MAVEIWPNGDIEISTAVIAGETYLRVHMVDGESGETVTIGFNLATFVTVTDQWKAVADELVDKQASERGIG